MVSFTLFIEIIVSETDSTATYEASQLGSSVVVQREAPMLVDHRIWEFSKLVRRRSTGTEVDTIAIALEFLENLQISETRCSEVLNLLNRTRNNNVEIP